MKRLLAGSVLLVVAGLPSHVPVHGAAFGGEKKSIQLVDQWERVAASEAQIPDLSKTQLLAELDRAAAAKAELESWEARYHVTMRYRATGARQVRSLRLVSSGHKWLCEARRENQPGYRVTSDGQFIYTVPADRKAIVVDHCKSTSEEENDALSVPELPLGFMPLWDNESYLPIRKPLPDIRTMVGHPNTKLLPWRTRVNGNACYVLERTTTWETPIFRSRTEFEAWRKVNAKTNRRSSIVIDSNAKPGEVRKDEETVRVALDPQSGFMPARWAEGIRFEMPRVEFALFPREEITCSEFRRIGEGVYVPGRLACSVYRAEWGGRKRIDQQSIVLLDDLQANKRYDSALFGCEFPNGYQVVDRVQGIAYLVGDPPGQMAALLAGARAKKAFYERLRNEPAPPLEGALWINSEPIRLDAEKGKQIVLYFWSYTCPGCASSVAYWQREYDQIARHSPEQSLITVHTFLDGEDLQRLREFLRQRQITFPVMVDRPMPEVPTWGRTFFGYRVFAAPTRIVIDEKGHVAGIPDRCVSAESWWVKSLEHRQGGIGRPDGRSH